VGEEDRPLANLRKVSCAVHGKEMVDAKRVPKKKDGAGEM